jgi:lipid A 3-O-deacylase
MDCGTIAEHLSLGLFLEPDTLSYSQEIPMPSTVIWRLLFSASPRSGSPTSPLLAWWGGRLRGAILILGFMATSLLANAQSSKPLDGQPWDEGVWVGGGFSVPGGTKDTHAMNAGVRLGKILTDNHLGGFLRGNFEWSGDLIPMYYIWQPKPAQNAYGAAFNPVNLKWNFTNLPRKVPFLELGGGVLFSDHAVPLNTSHVNFITHAAFGIHIFKTAVCAITPSIRYEHISNAGLTSPNPGINTVQFTIGLNSFGDLLPLPGEKKK